MNKLISTLACIGTGAVLAANPNGFPEYERTLKLTFATPQQAQQATLAARELPEGKTLAVSLRWDDMNPRHVPHQKTFGPHGWLANFYLCYSPAPFVKELLDAGCCIGNHTVTHPYLNFRTPNEIFRQIMEERMILETAYSYCISTYVSPSGFTYPPYGSDAGGPILHLIGDILQRCGHLGGPDNNIQLYGLKEDSYFGSFIFAVGDKDPKPERFKTEMDRCLTAIKQKMPAFGPYVTMGVHTWQSDEGFKILEEGIYKPYSNNPEWWYCTATDYYAYRYQFLHTKIEKTGVEGNTASFRITGCSGADLASNVPLTLECSAQIAKAEAGACNAKSNGCFISLEQAPGHEKPSVISRAENGMDNEGSLAFTLTHDAAANTLTAVVRNMSASAAENIVFALRLPPGYATGVLRQSISDIQPGAQTQLVFELGKASDRPFDFNDKTAFYLQTDYLQEKTTKRIYAKLDVPANKVAATDCPRDNMMVLGPISRSTVFPDGYLEKLSKVGEPLEALGESPMQRWHQMEGESFCPIGITTKYSTKGWPGKMESDVYCLYALEFESPTAQTVQLYHWRQTGRFFVNGQEVSNEKKATMTAIQAVQGVNRILVVHDTPSWNMEGCISVCTGNNPLIHLPCRKAQIKK